MLISVMLVNNGFTQPIIEWQKNFGGTKKEIAYSIDQTADGGYIVAGISESKDNDVETNRGFRDFWILKLNEIGEIKWKKNFGGSEFERAKSIIQTSDGGYIFVGDSDSDNGDLMGSKGNYDCWVLKLDNDGNIVWKKNYGGSERDFANAIQQTTDGGFVIAGYSWSSDGDINNSYNLEDYWIFKLDNMGEIQWSRKYGGSGRDFANSIEQTSDGGYIIAGETFSIDGDVGGTNGRNDAWIIKLSSDGEIEWNKVFGGYFNDYASSVRQTTDDGYIIAGQAMSEDGDLSSNNGNWDYWIFKLDNQGNLLWSKSYGGSMWDYARAIEQTIDGGYIVGGYSLSSDHDVEDNIGYEDYWILKLDSSGNIEWKGNYGGTFSDRAQAIKQTNDNGYIIAGYSWSFDEDVDGNNGEEDFWIVKLSSNVVNINEIRSNSFFSVFPNPNSGLFKISCSDLNTFNIRIIDLHGNVVFSKKNTSNFFEANHISNKGQYFVELTSSKGVFVQKIFIY